MRILAYAQLLESYSSLTMESLSKAFGVSEAFVDKYVKLSFSLSTAVSDLHLSNIVTF